MLVLSRMVGQEVVVPDCHLVLSVLEVRGDRIRLGISAPTEVRIYRREVWERVQAAGDDQAEAVAGARRGERGEQRRPDNAAHPSS